MSHPWQDFLTARAKAIIWMKYDMHKSDLEISQALSMDEEQVKLIREYFEWHPEQL